MRGGGGFLPALFLPYFWRCPADDHAFLVSFFLDVYVCVFDAAPFQSMLLATGHGIENVSDLPGGGSSLEQQPEPGRSKRKYTRGGHKKLKLVWCILC